MLAGVAAHEATIGDTIYSLASSISKNPQIVGAAWFASSAIFTTYSTNKYLKYDDNTTQVKAFGLSPSNALTLWRFLGSLCLGLVVAPDFDVLGRLHQTYKLSRSFALSAIFLFIANLSNS